SPTLQKNFNVKIIGGDDVSIERVPYQISLQYNGDHFCGGSIISQTYIVTAAHCTYEQDPAALSIRAGTAIRGDGGQVISVSKVHDHPNFNRFTADYDIAVLELETPLTLGRFVAPIVLPSENQTWPAGTEVFVSGWGALSEDAATFPTNLQGVALEIVDEAACVSAYGMVYLVTERMLCAGVNEGGKAACHEDSGGPLAVDGVLGGVVSWGLGCGRPGIPGVYANVPVLRDFIKNVTGI
ncbi:Trypsin and/or DUF1986 domain containing protein, partial [Asbolus verrucosus]